MITALDYLESLNSLGSVPGLASIMELLSRLNNPHRQLKIIHISGTNGKGSVGAFVDRILVEAGYTTGRFSSPAVMNPYEIIRINGEDIGEEEFAKAIFEIKKVCENMVKDGLSHPTRFEIETAAAYLIFAGLKVDYAVIECGMGGTLDATNVSEKTLCAVITPISVDHTAFLGDTIEEIAMHKAGIIKNACSVITTDANNPVMDIIKAETVKKNGELTVVDSAYISDVLYDSENMVTEFSYGDYKKLRIRLSGTYQCNNAILAIETIKALIKKGAGISAEALYRGLYEACWSGRFERICREPEFIIDGAHNPAGAKALANSLFSYYGNKKFVFILGVFKDKDIDGILKEIAVFASEIITIETPQNQRAMDCKILADIIKNNYNITISMFKDIGEAVEYAFDVCHGDNGIVACGSLSNLKRIKDEVRLYVDRRKGI